MTASACKHFFFVTSMVIFYSLMACTSRDNRNSEQMENSFNKGTYGFDAAFLANNNLEFIELKDPGSKAAILIAPGLQGRVLTSSAKGNEGRSFGWINYSLIESGEINDQFNPYGGEERIWLGPEGGAFSIYFEEGEEQSFPNWNVPKEIDTESFNVTHLDSQRVSFRKDFSLTNASGTRLEIRVERDIRILSRPEADLALALKLGSSISFVGYESKNVLINRGDSDWDRDSGALSIWMLSMFNPSEKGVVLMPFKTGDIADLGSIATDDYFGKVPADRLIIGNGILFFKTDGKYRGKIGLSQNRALPYCGSYDAENQVLTLLLYSLPDQPAAYVNSKWGAQDDPFIGDAVNAYNDGPVADGSIMGPFYEIESSSPAAFLSAGTQITHIQRTFHITGDEVELTPLTEKLFNMSIPEIKQVFGKNEASQLTDN